MVGGMVSGRAAWTGHWAGRQPVCGDVLRGVDSQATALAGASGICDVAGCDVLVYVGLGLGLRPGGVDWAVGGTPASVWRCAEEG